MTAAPTTALEQQGRGSDSPAGRQRRHRGLLVALFASLCVFALPAAPAFGEGSVDVNIGGGPPPGGGARHGLLAAIPGVPPATAGYRPIEVYAQAGETIQMAHSLMDTAGANILLFAPGADPLTATPLLDCAAAQPAAGLIDSRDQELAGPEAIPDADPDTYAACNFAATTDGIYQVVILGNGPGGGDPQSGTVELPNLTTSGRSASIWDVTVRALGVVQPGRAFMRDAAFATTRFGAQASDFQAYVYSRTGYEYQVNFYRHAGLNWTLAPDGFGVVDAATGDRTFRSFALGDDTVPDVNRPQIHFEARIGGEGRRYPVFYNRVDPLVISGPGGLGDTLGYSDVPISPGSNPLANTAFTGSGGQSGATDRGSGGTITFTSPAAMAGLGYTIEIDTNLDGTFGNGSDFVNNTSELEADGTNAFAWNGQDAAGTAPACGTYPYRIRSTLSEVHFPMSDVENSGGTRIERLSLPTDPALGPPLAASYDNRDPYKGNYVVTNGTPPFATDQTSGDGFNAWSATAAEPAGTGNTDIIDTWAQLPEVDTAGTLQVLCPRQPMYDLQITKSSNDQRVRLGDTLTYTLTARNNGPDAAPAGSVVRDTVPKHFRVLGVTAEGGAQCSRNGRAIRCTLPAMAAGAEVEVRVRVRAIASGRTRNTAFIDPPPDPRCVTSCDPVTPNNDDPAGVAVVKPKLPLTKTVNKKRLKAGEKATYTIRVRNPMKVTLRNVRTCDRLPAGLVYVSSKSKAKLSKGKYCWTAKRLAAGKSKTYKLTVRALAGKNQRSRRVNCAGARASNAKSARACRAVQVISEAPITPDPTG